MCGTAEGRDLSHVGIGRVCVGTHVGRMCGCIYVYVCFEHVYMWGGGGVCISVCMYVYV